MPNLPHRGASGEASAVASGEPSRAGEHAPPTGRPVVAVALPKGGVGKTTSAVNLAAELARLGLAVLLVDADTQGHAASLLGLDTREGFASRPTLADALADPTLAPSARITARRYLASGERVSEDAPPEATADAALLTPGQLDVLPGGPTLAPAGRELSRRDYGAERAVSDALAHVTRTTDGTPYALTLIDAAPGWDPVAVGVMFAASHVLCPVALDVLAFRAFGAFLPRLADIRAHRQRMGDDGPRLAAVLPTFLDGRARGPREVLSALAPAVATHPDAPRLLPPVRYSARLAEAPAWGETARETDPGGRAAVDYEAAARELADLLSLPLPPSPHAETSKH